MSGPSDQKPLAGASPPGRKSWKKPELRRIQLGEQQLAKLRQSDDPEALLRQMWPAIKERNAG